MKTEDKKKIGKKYRRLGKAFEVLVRKDLTEKGWLVFKNDNQVEFEVCVPVGTKEPIGRFVPAKAKWNNFTKRIMVVSGGFPDFVCIRKFDEEENFMNTGAIPKGKGLFINAFEVQFVEAKINGILDKAEKAKIEWIKSLHIPVFIAYQTKEGRKNIINYKEI